MTDTLLLLQLAFNALMFVAIVALYRSAPRPAREARKRRRVKPEARAPEPPPRAPAKPAPTHLEGLLESAEHTELVAGRELNERLRRLEYAGRVQRGGAHAAG